MLFVSGTEITLIFMITKIPICPAEGEKQDNDSAWYQGYTRKKVQLQKALG